MTKFLFLSLTAAVLATLLCFSCAKESAPDKPATLRVALSLPGDAAQQYGNIDLLAFDREGHFAGRWGRCGSEALVSLEKGRYTLIACSVGNEFVLSPEIMVKGETTLGGVTIRPRTDGAALYLGAAKDVELNGSDGQYLTISLTRNDGELATGVELVVWGMIQSNHMDL